MTIPRLAALLSLTLLLAAVPQQSYAQTAVDPGFYNYDSQSPVDATVTPERATSTYKVSLVTYPSPVATPYPANDLVKAYYYQPLSPGKHPAILVFHEWLPKNLKLDELLCERLAAVDIASLLVEEPYSVDRRPIPHVPAAEMLTPDVPKLVGNIRQTILDGRRGLDWMQARPEVDPKRMGVAGISLGAMLATLFTGVDSRAPVVLALDGGADIGDVIWLSPMTHGLRVKIQRSGYTYQQFHDAVQPIEPATWIHGHDPKNAFVVNGRYDIVIRPSQAQREADILGGAPVIWMNTGHYGLALGESQIADVGAQFLENRFYDRQPHPLPHTIQSTTIEAGLLVGKPEVISPAIAAHVLNFDEAGRFSTDAQLTLHGPAVALSARAGNLLVFGVRWPVSRGKWTAQPFAMVNVVL
jgi:acetyl esterase/lipase